MTHFVVKQALAERDLIDIWLYTYGEWGEAQADRYLDELDAAIHLIAEQPTLYRERPEFTHPIRIYHQSHHLIVYQVFSDHIVVVRVLHENMDIESRLP